MTDVVTLGETMLLVRGTCVGPLAVGAPAVLSFAGSEATVAIGLARLGHASRWLGRVGADPAGRLVVQGLRGEGVDVTGVTLDDDHPTGVLVRTPRTVDRHEVSYIRRGCAGSRLSPADLPPDAIESARLLHVTGITPALGPGPAAAVAEAVSRARAAGVPVSLDVNYRSRLWSLTAAAEVLRPLSEKADVLFCGLDELDVVREAGGPADGAEVLLRGACRQVVLTDGARGCALLTPEGRLPLAARAVPTADPVGAGDAFVAGYLSGWLDGLDGQRRLERAAACGAVGASTPGDWEGLPRREELGLLDGADVAR